jgi:hypothetical protein
MHSEVPTTRIALCELVCPASADLLIPGLSSTRSFHPIVCGSVFSKFGRTEAVDFSLLSGIDDPISHSSSPHVRSKRTIRGN